MRSGFREDSGGRVVTTTEHHETINPRSKLKLAMQAIRIGYNARMIRDTIDKDQADVVHTVNLLRLLSLSVYIPPKCGLPFVIEVANDRFVCAGPFLLRDGRNCG